MIRLCLIPCTYAQERELSLYWKSLEAQTYKENLFIYLADDGSGPETANFLKVQQKNWKDRLKHIWHEDVGYRKSLILNKAIAQMLEDHKDYEGLLWVVFTDTDLILHPRFLEDQVRFAANNQLFCGRRVDLSLKTSEWLRIHPEKMWSPEFYIRAQDSENANRLLRWENPWIRKMIKAQKVNDILGSNFGVDAHWLKKVCGFEEGLQHYWGEDGDLFIRLRNAGIQKVGCKSLALQAHLFHERRKPQAGAEEGYLQRLHHDFESVLPKKSLLLRA